MTRLRSPAAVDASFGEAGPRRSPAATAASAGWAAALLALVFLALHLPYLPVSLEDLDSINFALGLRHYDVAHHQPHPPGYPVFVVIARAVHAVVPSEAAALALVSAGGGALGVLALGALFRRFDRPDTPPRWSMAAVALAMTTPLYWFTAVRPLSDSVGLAAALAVQAMTLAASSTRALAWAAFCAGLGAGVRSQVVWLTVPLLILQGLRAQGSGLRLSGRSGALSLQPLALSLTLFLAGLLVWFIPLVAVSGGPAAYWHAVSDQGAEDLGNIQMLWTRHGARDVVDALYYAFVAPWAVWPVAAIVLGCALIGIVRLARRQRPRLTVLAVAFVPYLVFDLLFQETFTSRYALPLAAPMAYLAVCGLRAIPWDAGLAVAAALAMFCAHIGGTSIAAYSRAAAPAFRLLEAMRSARQTDDVAPVLAMDRRQSLDLRRPIAWVGSALPAVAQTLPAPPQHEWLEAVNYWNGGGRSPVWFVVDPLRTSIDLVQHGAASKFRWTVPYPVLLGGARPGEMDWYRVDRPEWFLGEGWALTPETAGVAAADHRGPSVAPITGWLDRGTFGGSLMIGGRSFDPASRPRLTVRVEDRAIADVALMPGSFLELVPLPADLVALDDHRQYAKVSVETSGGSAVAIEQFDASAARPLLGFGDGWQEPEFNPRTGVRWRWLSERGVLRVRRHFAGLRTDPPESPPPATLHLEGESPLTYFSRPSTLTIRLGNRVVLTRVLNEDFSVDLPLEGALELPPIALETDQAFSPAERGWRKSADRRHLGLRIFKAEIRITGRPAS